MYTLCMYTVYVVLRYIVRTIHLCSSVPNIIFVHRIVVRNHIDFRRVEFVPRFGFCLCCRTNRAGEDKQKSGAGNFVTRIENVIECARLSATKFLRKN